MQVSALPKGQGTVIPRRELLCVWGWAMGALQVSRGGCESPAGGWWPAPSSAARPTQAAGWHCTPTHTGLLCHRDCSGSGLPHPANLFSFSWKECHETHGIEHKAGVFTTTGITCIPNVRKYTKILLLLQVPHAWSCSPYLRSSL